MGKGWFYFFLVLFLFGIVSLAVSLPNGSKHPPATTIPKEPQYTGRESHETIMATGDCPATIPLLGRQAKLSHCSRFNDERVTFQVELGETYDQQEYPELMGILAHSELRSADGRSFWTQSARLTQQPKEYERNGKPGERWVFYAEVRYDLGQPRDKNDNPKYRTPAYTPYFEWRLAGRSPQVVKLQPYPGFGK